MNEEITTKCTLLRPRFAIEKNYSDLNVSEDDQDSFTKKLLFDDSDKKFHSIFIILGDIVDIYYVGTMSIMEVGGISASRSIRF